jgi:hypothetical protein
MTDAASDRSGLLIVRLIVTVPELAGCVSSSPRISIVRQRWNKNGAFQRLYVAITKCNIGP